MSTATPATKLSRLRAAYAAGDLTGALRIAARFPNLGDERAVILSAWGAIQNPRMYRQLGRDPEKLLAAGRDALIKKYDL